ncbi:MAG: futalosine hydrolase [Planctomycetota bacterium]|jgi:futalosine hydrolase|nr:futalosine hydrolase [Planctomycetota bacterium]MDP6763771.1 futalosine hydrolase [Planctomycetota bacterium]MDP6989193.1 futalosine hydrolase [Planctomycetota bacterium]
MSPSRETLILVPTDLERRRLIDRGGFAGEHGDLELCGFGPVAAAARTARLVAELRPRRVLLVGIAGSFDVERHPVGSATEFRAAAVDGVGVGEGLTFRGPPSLGFPQWPGSEDGDTAEVADRIALEWAGEEAADLLLTTCAASGSPGQAAMRRERFPAACAEDMEGFAVAMACHFAGVPLRIVRGISNEVGDRDPEHWRIPAALAAAHEAACALLAEPADWGAGG